MSHIPDIRFIFKALPRAEIILTLATDWLIDYMADTPGFNRTLTSIGLPLDVSALLEQKQDNKEWRTFIQHKLHQGIFTQSTAAHYTPFFITSQKAGKSFWLVHLSNHPEARDAMTRLHWKLQNHFTHYGEAGLNMMQGFDPKKEIHAEQLSIFSNDEFTFDTFAKDLTMKALLEQIPGQLSIYGGRLPYGEFYRLNANHTPATDEQIKNACALLSQAKVIVINTPVGGMRRKSHTISADDIIALPEQRTILLAPNANLSNIKGAN